MPGVPGVPAPGPGHAAMRSLPVLQVQHAAGRMLLQHLQPQGKPILVHFGSSSHTSQFKVFETLGQAQVFFDTAK